MKEKLIIFLKSNKKLLTGVGIGFICLIIAVIFIRTSETKVTSENMNSYTQQESEIRMINSRINEYYRELIDMTIRGNALAKDDEEATIVAYKYMIDDAIENINKISLEDLAKYHEFLVEYMGTTEEEEYNYFLATESFYYETKLYASYCNKIIELYEDKEFSEDDIKIIENIDEIRLSAIDKQFDKGSELYKLREEIYDNSGIGYEKYVKFNEKIKDLDGKYFKSRKSI